MSFHLSQYFSKVGGLLRNTKERKYNGLYSVFLRAKCWRPPFFFRKKEKLQAFHCNSKAIRFCCSSDHLQHPNSPGSLLALSALCMPCIPHVQMSWALGILISCSWPPLAFYHFPKASVLRGIPPFPQIPVYSFQFRRRCPGTEQWKSFWWH